VVLKSLEEAQRDEDNILAVLNGSAINQDGRSSGLTVPNGPSQEKGIRDALMDRSLTPADVGYLEAHGTGTSLGDPIEANSIVDVPSEGRSRRKGVVLSAVKSNIGHLKGAAGIAGLIKIILAVQKPHIPGTYGFSKLRCHQLAQRPFQEDCRRQLL
jgi:acyl transferase domain-containing protein